jgi:uncharacterized protein YcbK (DUF882 family)
MKISKYFTKAEMECPLSGECNMTPEFMEHLDAMREAFGKGILITSGYRSEKQNKKIGGYAFSKHLTGQAADIPVNDPHERWKLVKAAMTAGMTGIEIANKHVHVEFTDRKDPILWTGISK